MITMLDGQPVRLKHAHDLSWVAELGRVFAVFDGQDSGNLCLGVERDGVRRFVKYAGAPTVEYSGQPEDAVVRLQAAAAVYEALKAPELVNLIGHFAVGGGYAALFDWFPGEGMHQPGRFSPRQKYSHPDSPNYRFLRLDPQDKMEAIDTLLRFHRRVEARGYVAIDCYDGNLLVDFARPRLRVCDIDFYRPAPYINTMGRMWGSSRLMSPEEFTRGAVIDGRTNVFGQGALIFSLVAAQGARTRESWTLGSRCYEVAFQAVSPHREDRFASMDALCHAWNRAAGEDGFAVPCFLEDDRI
jgi:serine/threonine-protein kinase